MENVITLEVPEDVEEKDLLAVKMFPLPSNFYELDSFVIDMPRISDVKFNEIVKQGQRPFLYPVNIMGIVVNKGKVTLSYIYWVSEVANTLPHRFKALKLHQTLDMSAKQQVRYQPIGTFLLHGTVYNLFEVLSFEEIKKVLPPPPPQSNIVPASFIPKNIDSKGN